MLARYIVLFACFLNAQAQAATNLFFVDAQPVLKVHSNPGEGTETVDKLAYGVSVRVREESLEDSIVAGRQGRWVKIQYHGNQFGWVFSAFLAKPSRKTDSFAYYYRGNTAYRDDRYYDAVANYQKSVESATNEVEQIKAFGALAQTSVEQSNRPIAVMYAQKVFAMDGQNEFALSLVAGENNQQFTNASCPDRTLTCLALTWGPDVCGMGFNYFANQIGGSIPGVISSPGCLIAISEALEEAYSGTDVSLAVVTGLLDQLGKAGLDSEGAFNNIFGALLI